MSSNSRLSTRSSGKVNRRRGANLARASAAVSFVACAGVVGLASLATAGGSLQIQPAAGDPLPGLTAAELQRFDAGAFDFGRTLDAEEGLGPIFNKAGCFSCHTTPLGGWGTITVTRFGRFDKKTGFDPLEEWGGSLLQAETNAGPDCQEVIPDFADVIALRVTNSSLAFGLIEAIPDEDILANEDPFDANADGVRGFAHMVEAVEDDKGSPLRVGRFGWKAQVATVLTFSGDASANEMGLTNRLFPEPIAPNADLKLLALCDPTLVHPEDGPDGNGLDFIDRVTDFQRFLAPPPQTPRSGMNGEAIFNTIGCAVCHVPSWTTSDDVALEDPIRNKTIRPYSNFLLHNMGILGDGIIQGSAGSFDIRTPTLWNVRTRDPMLHDGRAAGGTFHDRIAGPGGAIWWHNVVGSEAQGAGQAFFNLSPADQDAVVAFLDSLGRREFDSTGDGNVDYGDFIDFQPCFNAVGPYGPDHPCAVHDIDQDGDVDLEDFSYFLEVYTGPMTDCDKDGVPDIQQILLGELVDSDADGIPDICGATVCVADLNGDKVVDGADLGLLLTSWGNRGGSADLNKDGIVDGADLGLLLTNWGKCG